jgi:LuxR family transcriptional regulator, maltose regulon positive regulatory protein
MDSYVLTTKLRIPPDTHTMVRRSRLVDDLERQILTYKLAHISAPAGYGKTTLLSQWARDSRFPVVWVSLGEEDNDPHDFFRCLLTAWDEVQPGVKESQLGLLLGTWMPDMQAVLPAFLNAAADVQDHTVLVLDDYHAIENPAIHEAMAFLLDHLPPMFHIVLAGRSEAPLPLARYRARNEMLELRTENLQFRAEETGEFLNQILNLGLIQDEIVRLQSDLEGWIAGLQLVALTLRRPGEMSDKLEVTGRHGFIADYLNDDVLAHLPEDSRQFLFRTSILESLCASLCNAVTGRDDGQDLLETIARQNLFLMELDHQREWFRYHGLFSDVLREELHRRYPDDVTDLHQRAARWYLDHELPEQAFRHAVTGEDVDLVVEIFERYAYLKLLGGEIATVKRWMDSIPDTWRASLPMLDLAQAGLLMFMGQFDACVQCVDGVEQRLMQSSESDVRHQLARVSALRCFVACFQNDLTQAESYADLALRDLSHDDLTFRAGICGALGDTYRRNGYWEQARQSYRMVLDFSQAPAFRFESAHVFGALADLDLRQGYLRNAAAYWRRALAACEDPQNWGKVPLPVIGWVSIRMAETYYEWNELSESWDHLARGLRHAEAGGDARAMMVGYVLASRLSLATGNIAAAAEYLERARPLVEDSPFVDWISHFERCQLELWLAQDRLRAAVHWSDEMLRGATHQERPESETAQLAMARVLIIQGDTGSLARALTLLRQLQSTADSEGRLGITIEAMALHAIADWRSGSQADAMTALERSLRLAEPEGYVRLYVDLGLPMARLLQEARSRNVMPEYVSRLLAAHGPVRSSSSERALPEPLTEREQEILELLASGLTNREIAGKLFITQQTVKKHLGNIYGKLGVHRRTEAVARARELEMLS